MLYDQFGREIEIAKRPETREIAVTTIRDRWSTYPSQGLTPQKLADIFKEADGGDVYRQAELFEEMEEKDTHLFSELQTRKNAVLGLDYDLDPYSDSAEDKKISDFVGEILFGLTDFEDALLDLLDAIGKGYALIENLWDVQGKSAAIAGFRWIHAKRAVFYERGSTPPQEKSFELPRIMTAAEPFKGEEMPPWKLVYLRYKARSGYDTRAGVLRVCAWMYLFKNYSLKDWVAFAEVFGMPLRLGKYEPGAGQQEKDALMQAVQSLGADAAGIISKNTEIEFVETMKNAGSNNIYQQLAEFCDKQMSKAILGQTATTEGTPGKLGNEDAQDKVRQDLVRADEESLAKTIRAQIIRPLVGYNFGWDKPLPWFVFKFEPPEDLKSTSEVYKNLSEIGFPFTVKHVSERFKVPMPEDGEALLNRPLMAPGPAIAAKQRIVGKDPAAPILPGTRTIDEITSQSLDEASADELMGPVEDLLDKCQSLDEFRDRLLDIYGAMDPTALGNLMQRALVLAELSGRFDAVER
jgi:phage gp29-like protein